MQRILSFCADVGFDPDIHNITVKPVCGLSVLTVERKDLIAVQNIEEKIAACLKYIRSFDSNAVGFERNGNACFVFDMERKPTPSTPIDLLRMMLDMVTASTISKIRFNVTDESATITLTSPCKVGTKVEFARASGAISNMLRYFNIDAPVRLNNVRRNLPYIRQALVELDVVCVLDSNGNFKYEESNDDGR